MWQIDPKTGKYPQFELKESNNKVKTPVSIHTPSPGSRLHSWLQLQLSGAMGWCLCLRGHPGACGGSTAPPALSPLASAHRLLSCMGSLRMWWL